MEEQKLRQLFKNRSNCYVDTDDVVQGMDEDCFVETVNEALRIHDVVNRRELLLDFADYSESDKTSQTTDECVDNYLDSVK
jgi:hypothetical protein